jgi:hypothetical protein
MCSSGTLTIAQQPGHVTVANIMSTSVPDYPEPTLLDQGADVSIRNTENPRSIACTHAVSPP